jgi:hypothetical protein
MMYAKQVLASFVLASVCMAASSGYAIEPVLCDPAQDPDGCECSSAADECYQIAPKDLISPDDPTALRQAAGIQSQWDAQRGVYVVEADVTGLTAAGVMKLNSNQGQWDDRAEMFEYLGELIGQDLSDWMCTPEALVPLELRQKGTTVRYNQFDEEWARANSGNIIFDAISDENGDVFFDASGFNLFPAATCDGSDPDAFDSRTQNGVAAEQCSTAEDTNTGVSCEEEPIGVDCGPNRCNSLGEKSAQTTLRTADTLEHIGNSPRCIGVDVNGELICDVQSGVIVRERVEADNLKIESTFFSAGTAEDPTDPADLDDSTDTVHFLGNVNGVCSEGTVEEGNTTLLLNTKEGSYDSSAPLCNEVI